MADDQQKTEPTATDDQSATAEAEQLAGVQEETEVEEIVAETTAESTTEELEQAEEAVASEETVTETVASGLPEFRAGDTLRLGVRITEGDKTRIQFFEGIVLARHGAGASQTFTIRKIGAGGIAVERIFPLYSPTIASFEVRRRGATRRAKIYFLRDIVGSTANVIKERKVAKETGQADQKRAARHAARQEKRAAKAERATKADKPAAKTSRSAKRAGKKTEAGS